MIDYGDILGYLEELVEDIDFGEINLLEIKSKLQNLITEIEDRVDTAGDSYDDFDFDDLG
jgi:hypothetical protein